MSFFTRLTDFFFPASICLGCGHPRKLDTGAALCDDCASALAEAFLRDSVCPVCLSPVRKDEPCAYCLSGGMQGLTAAFAPYHYHGIVQKLVTCLKFSGVEDAAAPLAQAMERTVTGRRFDALVPVPLSRGRYRERGFNQAEILCKRLSPGLSAPVLCALARTRETKRQSGLTDEALRKDNVRDAFQCLIPVHGLRLLLIDDVRTTGSTARACAKALLQGGAAEVSLLTAAVAPPRREKKHA